MIEEAKIQGVGGKLWHSWHGRIAIARPKRVFTFEFGYIFNSRAFTGGHALRLGLHISLGWNSGTLALTLPFIQGSVSYLTHSLYGSYR